MATLLTAGCGLFGGDSDSDASSDSTTGAAAADLEKPNIRIGVMVGIDCSGAQLALQNKLFEEEGLTVTPETVVSGQKAIPALESGQLDFTFGNWVSFMKAQSTGADLKFVSESYISTPNSNFALIAAPDSGVNSVRDLPGKKVAVNVKGNINELLIRAVFEANGLDYNSIELVELAFPDMEGALKSKLVDVASVLDPFVVNAQKNLGAKVVVDLTGKGPTENFPVAGFATTGKFAKENPKTVAAFQRALLKGQQLAGDRKNVEEALPKFSKMPAETAAIVRIGQFPTTIDDKRLQRIADLLTTYNMWPPDSKPIEDVKSMVIPIPASSS